MDGGSSSSSSNRKVPHIAQPVADFTPCEWVCVCFCVCVCLDQGEEGIISTPEMRQGIYLVAWCG